MYGDGHPRLSLHLGEEEGGWEYLANGSGVRSLSVSRLKVATSERLDGTDT